MRAVLLVVAATVLAGCASSAMEAARSQAPTKAFNSSKAADVVAQCIQFGWQDEDVFGVDASGYLEPGKQGGFTVYTREAESFADIRAQGGSTAVSYYAKHNDNVALRRMAALATCL
ncbi:hypothetical protein [Pseudomonas rubra]|uniref:Lipoprotein n=1 Tax=Pseudomonas rubra TaxID=2942627 RepID=A0ABT5PFU9_9PSED|nr:hypothetical protein [Pseudomonas rubra]MDD1017187.1 hypothetical protein [Pseudomonas rubra]MDD1041196.1 hypothetical protein [Pseudomonas rubra]MDD1157998.1 hypothetical protein [Pseudomonas rubra]